MCWRHWFDGAITPNIYLRDFSWPWRWKGDKSPQKEIEIGDTTLQNVLYFATMLIWTNPTPFYWVAQNCFIPEESSATSATILCLIDTIHTLTNIIFTFGRKIRTLLVQIYQLLYLFWLSLFSLLYYKSRPFSFKPLNPNSCMSAPCPSIIDSCGHLLNFVIMRVYCQKWRIGGDWDDFVECEEFQISVNCSHNETTSRGLRHNDRRCNCHPDRKVIAFLFLWLLHFIPWSSKSFHPTQLFTPFTRMGDMPSADKLWQEGWPCGR